MINFGIGRLWAGTEDSLHHLLERYISLTPEQMAFFMDDDEGPSRRDRGPRLLSKSGNLAVVSIKGPLVNNDDRWWNEFFGLSGYGEIREALVAAAQDEEVERIMLDIDSPGGAVSGMSDVSDLIRQVNTIKPVHAHTSGTMASAAYALGSSAGSVSASRMADIGSIGVLQVHRESTRLMERMGVTNTVIRAGEFKALGNPFETLSDTAKETMQASCDYAYKLFLDQVADARGVSPEYAKEHMGEGRVFTGEQAKAVNLVDEITNYDTAITNFASLDVSQQDKNKKTGQYIPDRTHSTAQDMKPTLTPMAIAAAKAAKEAADKAAQAAAGKTEGGAGEAGDPAANSDPAATDGDTPETQVADATAGKGEDASQTLMKAQARIEVLQEDKATLQAQLAIAHAEVTSLKAAAESGAKAAEGLRSIAQATVRTLCIALDQSVGAEMSMTDEKLLEEHARLSALFDANFKAGGIATPGAAPQGSAEVDVERHARLKAARLNRK